MTTACTYRMLVVPDVPLHGSHTHTGDINVPVVKVVSLRHSVHHPGIDGIAVDDLDLGEPYALFEA